MSAGDIQNIVIGLILLAISFTPNFFSKADQAEHEISTGRKRTIRLVLRIGGIALLVLGLT